MEKVPGGHDLKEKASQYTEKAVDRVGHGTETVVQQWKTFIDQHMKKEDKKDESKPTTDTVTK